MFLEVYSQVLGVSTLKVCITCGKEKSKHEFSKSRAKKDGLHPVCKGCDHARRRAHYAAHADEERQKKREYYAENQESILAYQSSDRAANPEKYRARDHKRDRAKTNERKRGYYAADPDKHRRIARESYARNPEARHLRNREWRDTERGKLVARTLRIRYYARKRSLPDEFTTADWQAALNYFGGCCAVCGRPQGLWHTLAADHWIPLNSPDCPGTVDWNIVPLCHGNGGCNNSKQNRPAAEWLVEKFGPRKGRAILRKIEAFLDSRRPAS